MDQAITTSSTTNSTTRAGDGPAPYVRRAVEYLIDGADTAFVAGYLHAMTIAEVRREARENNPLAK